MRLQWRQAEQVFHTQRHAGEEVVFHLLDGDKGIGLHSPLRQEVLAEHLAAPGDLIDFMWRLVAVDVLHAELLEDGHKGGGHAAFLVSGRIKGAGVDVDQVGVRALA